MKNQTDYNRKNIDIETEQKIIKIKETMLINKTLSENKRIGIFDKSTKDIIIHIFIWLLLIFFGFSVGTIAYNVLNGIALNILSTKTYIIACIPFLFGVIQIFFTFWGKYRGLLFRFFGTGLLLSQIVFAFNSFKSILTEVYTYNVFTQAIQFNNASTELYACLIVLLCIYFILFFINISLNIKTIIFELF